MKIILESIPYESMRYPSLGDWTVDGEAIHIFVAESDSQVPLSKDEMFLIARHEMDEAWLCLKHGITQEQVDHFDIEVAPKLALLHYEEPGDHLQAPYRKEHRAAMLCEHQMASFLGLDDYRVVR